MDKIKQHFQNNFAIYAVLLVCLVIIAITLFVTKNNNQEEKIEEVDTSMFKVLTLKQTLELFDDKSPKLLVIGHKTCSATIKYTSYLQIAQAKFGFQTYYLDLTTIDETQIEDYNKLVEKLDFEYNYNGAIDKFSKFIGDTPMTIVIKNKKQESGYIGSMNDSTLGTIVKQYGITS